MGADESCGESDRIWGRVVRIVPLECVLANTLRQAQGERVEESTRTRSLSPELDEGSEGFSSGGDGK